MNKNSFTTGHTDQAPEPVFRGALACGGIRKCPTGVTGLDEITGGGLPKGRPTLVCGAAGSGKTMLAMEFLVRGARQFNEPGVFVSFEERTSDLIENVSGLGFDLQTMIDDKLIHIDYVHIDRDQIEETGAYDLEGLFVRLNHAVQSVGARRVVLDTIETLFSGLSDSGILRAEINRLFRWLKDQGLTAVVTAERGHEDSLTRHGLEEYISDCVIALDHRIHEQVSTRRLRVVKYRGTAHGTNEYPFLIDAQGLSVMPVTSMGLDHVTSDERVSTGVPGLDDMLEGRGYYHGSSILISGPPGTGKTTFAASFLQAVCARGDRAMYFAFEESPNQILRNMKAVGIDLQQWLDRDLLEFHATRPTLYGTEMHLMTMHRMIDQFRPQAVVIDPISNLETAGTQLAARVTLLLLIDFLKKLGITALCTNLAHAGSATEHTESQVSSMMDTWIQLRAVERAGERTRNLYVIKSRGMAHSNQICEFTFSVEGVNIIRPHAKAPVRQREQ